MISGRNLVDFFRRSKAVDIEPESILAIEHTKQEIARLYAATTGVNTQFSGVSLHDVFKMDAVTLFTNKIHYRTQVLHKGEPRDSE